MSTDNDNVNYHTCRVANANQNTKILCYNVKGNISLNNKIKIKQEHRNGKSQKLTVIIE